MQVELVAPSEALLPYIRVFYRAVARAPIDEGIERVDLGQLRFFLRGKGALGFPDRHFEIAPAVSVMAPAMAVRIYRTEAPVDVFGVALRPLGWAALIGLDARDAANHVIDAAPLLAPGCDDFLALLRAQDSLSAMAEAAETFLRDKFKPVPEAHVRLIKLVRQWECSEHPVIEDLYAAAGMSGRQLARLINHYYGGPPKFLERKFRAMRAAERIARGENLSEVAEHFYDQPHMNRELKRFVGHTPRGLQESTDPILRAALTLEQLDWSRGND
jgi:AraC-like DNA-binding protein